MGLGSWIEDHSGAIIGGATGGLAGAGLGALYDSSRGGGGSSGPAAPSGIDQAALTNAETGRRMAEIAGQQFDFGKQQYSDLKPFYDQILQQNVDIGKASASQAAGQWEDYQNIFRPIEARVAADAMAAGTPEMQAAKAQRAQAAVGTQFEAGRDSASRRMAAVGVNPASMRNADFERQSANEQALAEAGAGTNAANAEEMRGIALRSGAAQFGRNMPQTGIASNSLALNAGSSGVGTAGAMIAGRNAATSAALPWYQAGTSATTAGGNLLLGQYGIDVSSHNAQLQADAMERAGMYGALGSLAGGGMAMAARSSKEAKTDKESVDEVRVLEAVKGLTVESWRYKPGEGDGGEHLGPYAEDVHEKFGERAAPGGGHIDLISMNGINLTATKALAKQVDRLTKDLVAMKFAARGIERRIA